jgi:hypothetical protein
MEITMTPQERQLVAELFDRLAALERNPRDPEAERLIEQGLDRSPHAPYALVQTVLLQDEALKRANAHIEQLEAALGSGREDQQGQGGFLDTMRDAVFGRRDEGRGSVPSVGGRGDAPMGVPPGYRGASDPWGRGGGSGAPYGQGPGTFGQAQGPYGQGQYGGGNYQNEPAAQGGRFGQGGSFLGTAAAVAAGAIGGSLLLNSFRGMFGGQQQHGAFDQASASGLGDRTPWDSGAGSGDLSRQAGLGDIGRSDVASTRSYDPERAGAFDSMQGDPGSDNLGFDDGFDSGGDAGEP